MTNPLICYKLSAMAKGCLTGGIILDRSLITGLSVILLAYGLTWFFIIRSNSIIEKINMKGLKNTREIEKELEL